MAPKKSIAKKSDAGKKSSRKADSGVYYLWIHSTGTEVQSTHYSTDAVVEAVLNNPWLEHLHNLIHDWCVQHPRYGWQDAANVMITTEDFVTADLRGFWSRFFKLCMSSKGSFEAKHNSAKICCYRGDSREPFWRDK